MDSEALERVVGRDALHAVVDLFTVTIAASFATHPTARTHREVKRRFDVCLKILGVLRKDLGWTLERITDNLPVYLRCELDGVAWEPSKRAVWLADG